MFEFRCLTQASLVAAIVFWNGTAQAKTVDLGTHERSGESAQAHGIAGTFRLTFDTRSVVRDAGISLVTLVESRESGTGIVFRIETRLALACELHDWGVARVSKYDARGKRLSQTDGVVKFTGEPMLVPVARVFGAVCGAE